MILERQGATLINDPSPKQLELELKRLKISGRSSFASLTDDSGSYVQVAGGGVACMLEWRDYKSRSHMRAYLKTSIVPFEDGTELIFAGGRIPLRQDEWLNINLIIKAFVAFSCGEPFPAAIFWRDMSEIFDF